MAEENPLTVFVAENAKIAEAVLGLLAGAGIAAETVTAPHRAEFEPITGMTDLVTPDEIEVRVTDPKKAGDARDLLGNALSVAALRAIREKRANRTGTVTAVCEECGKSSEWLASAMGTTDTCPHCQAYMDIPDPDDDWSGVDFGTDEEEDGQEK